MKPGWRVQLTEGTDMKTIYADMTAGIDRKLMQKAGDILLSGGLVAFPTETVYGLGGNALMRRPPGRYMRRREDLQTIR